MRKRTPWDLPEGGPRRSTRLRWFLLDLSERIVEPFLVIGWRLEDFFAAKRARLLGVALVLAALVGGGFAAAFKVAGASTAASTGRALRIVTLRQKTQTRVNGRIVTHWRVRKVYAQPQKILETRTIQTPNGIRVVTHPVTRYRVDYRKEVVTADGQTRTLVRPITNNNTETVMGTVTRQVTDTHVVTQLVTVTQPVTVGVTTTVVSTETETLPITVTITIP
jgi:hypothetical protein